MKEIFSIYFQRKYSTQCVILLFLLISARELCPMSYAESHALYARKVSKTYSSTLCYTSLERYIYISYRRFGKPSVVNFNCFFFTFTYLIPTILFLVCTLKSRVLSDPREAFIMILQKLPELAHVFAVGVRKQSQYTLIF